MCLCVFVFEEVTGCLWGGTIPHSASPPRAPQFTWAMACFQLWLGFQHSNMGTPGYIVAAQQSFNSLLDHRNNYCYAVGCYKIMQCYAVSQVQNNCCPTERQCVAQCEQFNSLPPTADELFSLLWASVASLSIATSFNPSWVAFTLIQKNRNYQDLFGGVGVGADAESITFI